MKPCFFAVVVFYLCCCPALAVESAPLTPALPVDAAFARQLEGELLLPIVSQIPGAAVVAVLNGRVVLEKTYGVRQQGEAAMVDAQTLFRLASLSKTFASAAAAIMLDEVPMTWQTPVSQSLRDLRFKRADYGAQINLQHLLSQTSGLMPHAYTNLVEDRMSYAQIIKRLDRVNFVCPPGACYGYQNVVFSLVGDVVEANVGVDYPTYVSRRIFAPLAMARASFGEQAFLGDGNHAAPHIFDGQQWRSTRSSGKYYKVPPAAGVNASINDMRAWLLAQLGQSPEVLTPAMLDAMQSMVIATTRKQAHYARHQGLSNTGYGLGWRVFDYDGETGNVHHGGYVRGMRSEMVFNRKLQTGMVFLTNSEPGVINHLVFDFLDLARAYRFAAHPASGAPQAFIQLAADPGGLAHVEP